MAADASDERLFQRLASLGLLKQQGSAPSTPRESVAPPTELDESAGNAAVEYAPADLAASAEPPLAPPAAKPQQDRRLNELLRRISELTGDPEAVKVEEPPSLRSRRGRNRLRPIRRPERAKPNKPRTTIRTNWPAISFRSSPSRSRLPASPKARSRNCC
jgi:hypothetical protein